MGSAVGQVPEYIEMVARWCKAHTRMPVIVKLTPNITDIRQPGARGEERRRRRGVADQHHQLDHGRRPRPLVARAAHRRQGHARRLLRPGGQADRAAHGLRDRARPRRRRPADLGHRRHHHLARRGRVHGARRRQRAGLHGGDDLRLQDRRGDDRPACRDYMDEKGYAHDRRLPRPRRANVTDWQYLNLNYVAKARSTRTSASSAAAATSSARTPRTRRSPPRIERQAPFRGHRSRVRRLQSLRLVCPVEDCITLEHKARASTRAPASTMRGHSRTGRRIPTTRRRTQGRRNSAGPGRNTSPAGSRRFKRSDSANRKSAPGE